MYWTYREYILVAVSNHEYALYHASDDLKSDPEIVLAAISKYEFVLQYASDELKSDIEYHKSIYHTTEIKVLELMINTTKIQNQFPRINIRSNHDTAFRFV